MQTQFLCTSIHSWSAPLGRRAAVRSEKALQVTKHYIIKISHMYDIEVSTSKTKAIVRGGSNTESVNIE
jgi:hypothetical protein